MSQLEIQGRLFDEWLGWVDFPWVQIEQIGPIASQYRFNSPPENPIRYQTEITAATERQHTVFDFQVADGKLEKAIGHPVCNPDFRVSVQ